MNNYTIKMWTKHLISLRKKETTIAFLASYEERWIAQKRLNAAIDRIKKLLEREVVNENRNNWQP